MSVYHVITKIEDRDTLPVRLNEVRDLVMAHCQLKLDHLRFIPVNIDPAVLMGVFHLHTSRATPYGDPEDYADILYARRLEPPERRLVCCKEMIHAMDKVQDHVAARTSIDELLRTLTTPLDVRTAVPTPTAMRDRSAILEALAMLFPWQARELLMTKYEAGRIGDSDIAEKAIIPERYVPFLMSDAWQTIYEIIMRARHTMRDA